MKTIVFFLEEKSAKECLSALMPKLLEGRTDIEFRCITFDGKCDLDKNLERCIRYWRAPDTCFVVIRDQDAGDCRKIKKAIKEKCKAAGRPDTLIRIACRELEAFYMGDINAVRQAFPRCTASPTAKKFRNPDGIGAPAEELRKITNGEYQKIGGSRKISPLLKLDGSNRSQSFNTLIRGITRVIEELAQES